MDSSESSVHGVKCLPKASVFMRASQLSCRQERNLCFKEFSKWFWWGDSLIKIPSNLPTFLISITEYCRGQHDYALNTVLLSFQWLSSPRRKQNCMGKSALEKQRST